VGNQRAVFSSSSSDSSGSTELLHLPSRSTLIMGTSNLHHESEDKQNTEKRSGEKEQLHSFVWCFNIRHSINSVS